MEVSIIVHDTVYNRNTFGQKVRWLNPPLQYVSIDATYIPDSKCIKVRSLLFFLFNDLLNPLLQSDTQMVHLRIVGEHFGEDNETITNLQVNV